MTRTLSFRLCATSRAVAGRTLGSSLGSFSSIGLSLASSRSARIRPRRSSGRVCKSLLGDRVAALQLAKIAPRTPLSYPQLQAQHLTPYALRPQPWQRLHRPSCRTSPTSRCRPIRHPAGPGWPLRVPGGRVRATGWPSRVAASLLCPPYRRGCPGGSRSAPVPPTSQLAAGLPLVRGGSASALCRSESVQRFLASPARGRCCPMGIFGIRLISSHSGEKGI